MENKPHQPHNVYKPVNPTYPNPDYNLNFDSHDTNIDVDQTNIDFDNYYVPAQQHYNPAQQHYNPGMGAPAHTPAPTMVAPGTMDPMQECQTDAFENVVIPHVHPSHTTHHMHTHYVNQHYFPHTESCCYTTSCEDVFCGPMPPCPYPMAGGPGLPPHPAW